jgi:biopolymer transport protein ExbD
MIQLRPGGQSADFAELHRTLASLKHSDLNPSGPFLATDPVIIESGEHVRWGHVVNAFNQAVRAGYTNINFAQNSR